jgi:tetratricopeptide (TPR) repeat protein
MTKAVGYVRTPGGASDPGPGALDAQRGRIWAWCKAQGFALDDIHGDADGTSALDAALQAAWGATLVVDSIPGLAATIGDLSGIARRIREGGTRLVCLTEGIDTEADPGAAALQLLEAAAALAGAPGSPAPRSAPAPAAPAPETPAFTFAGPAAPPADAAPVLADLAAVAPLTDADFPSEWGDVLLDAGTGGYLDEGFDPPEDDGLPAMPDPNASPPGMQIALGDLEGTGSDAFAPEEEADAGSDADPDGATGPARAPEAARPLAPVSPVESDVVPSGAGPDDPAGPLPPNPAQRAFIAEGAVTKVRHRRESDYAAAAEKASRQVQRGRLEKAAAIWNHFLKGAEGAVAGRAWNHLGDIHVRAGRPVEAIDAWLQAARCFEGSHYNNMAVATLKKVLKLDLSRAEIQRQVAELNARCDKVGDAVDGYLAYARHLKAAGRLAEALEVFARIRILDPVNARHRMQLADELHTFGFEGEAVREALYAGELLLERGAVSEAEEHLVRWTDRVPEAPELSQRLAALRGGTVETPMAPGAGVDGGVLLTTGGAGRARAEEPGWERTGY